MILAPTNRNKEKKLLETRNWEEIHRFSKPMMSCYLNSNPRM
jgi:hypothetical protein